MASPVITSVEVQYPNGGSSAAPGEQVRIVVTATDADSYTITGSVTVSDVAGNAAGPVAFSVVVSDRLTYTASADAGTIAADPAAPNQFVLTIPS
jgi:hypothetical protein